MADKPLTIRKVVARAVVAPISRPLRTAVGVIPAAPLILIDVVTHEGIMGNAYVFGYTPTMLPPLLSVAHQLAPFLQGKSVVPSARFQEMDLRFKLLGIHGLVGMVLSGLDMAYWDALGKAAGKTVVSLLGSEPRALRAYDSYGIIDWKKDEVDIRRSIDQGFTALKIKVGDADLSKDIDAIRAVRDMIGPNVSLMVDYNQSLSPAEACYRIERIQGFDLEWVEEPVSAQDLQGHARVRALTGARIQTGENWWFPRDLQRAISAGASDYAMLDLMKIGGVTGWMQAAGQADGASLPVSSHVFLEASAHVLAATPTCHYLEYLDFAGAILEDAPVVTGGRLTPKGPGLGITWDESAIGRYLAS